MGLALTGLGPALEYLFARTTGESKLGLERTVALLAALGDPHEAYPSLHVAGTNGKGSSVATCAALLRSQGLRVARYTSPHLVDFRERIVVGDEPIPGEAVVEWVDRHTPTVERLGATFFEATTALAFDWFARAGAEIAVIETGLGGRLDSTNVLDPVAAGVTSIGLDHTEYLGNTLDAIAREKAGIFKSGRPAVIGEPDDALRGVLVGEATSRRAAPIHDLVAEHRISGIALDGSGTRFRVDGAFGSGELWTPLTGAHQAGNALFAIALVEAAGDRYHRPLELHAEALRRVALPGRFQRVGRWLFDVAHNPAGAEVLAATIRSAGVEQPVCALVSVLGDKDWRGMIRALAPVVEHFVLTTAPTAPASRLWSLAAAARFAQDAGLSSEAEADFDVALERASRRGATTLVTGSFHTVGDAMARLQVSPLTG